MVQSFLVLIPENRAMGESLPSKEDDGQFDQEIASEGSPNRRYQRSPIVSTRVNCPLLM